MSQIENEAWVEAVARALVESFPADPNAVVFGKPTWAHYEAEARAVVSALTPLVIERCAEAAIGRARRLEKVDGCGPMVAAAEDIAKDIRALIPEDPAHD